MFRLKYLGLNTLCEHCRRALATDIDHITPCQPEDELFWDEDNWQALCHSCHSRKTASQDGGFGNARRN